MESKPLWQVWWLWGIPTIAAICGLAALAEMARTSGHPRWGDALDLARLALYCGWLQQAWHCSRNVRRPVWTPLARAVLILGLVVNVLV